MAYVRDTQHFISRIKQLGPIPEHALLVTLDVSSQNTNIPYHIHTEHEAIQSLRVILQTSLGSKSDHILYAYNFTDAEDLSVNRYYSDGE